MALVPLVQSLLLTALPAGGQATARRNAWSAVAAGSARSRGRREADAAMAAAAQRVAPRAGTGS